MQLHILAADLTMLVLQKKKGPTTSPVLASDISVENKLSDYVTTLQPPFNETINSHMRVNSSGSPNRPRGNNVDELFIWTSQIKMQRDRPLIACGRWNIAGNKAINTQTHLGVLQPITLFVVQQPTQTTQIRLKDEWQHILRSVSRRHPEVGKVNPHRDDQESFSQANLLESNSIIVNP